MGPVHDLDALGAPQNATADNIAVVEALDEKHPASIIDINNASDLNPDKELPDQEAQKGVQIAEAVSIIWSKTTMRIVFISIILLYFVNAFEAQLSGNLTAFVTSSFEAHSLIPVMYTVSDCMSAAFRLPIAKMLDIWGRGVGFAVMAIVSTIGMVMMAACQNIATYAAAQAFFNVGFSGMIFSVDVITADISSLKHRGLAYAITSSPYIITAFAGPAASEAFYEKINFRWGFGIFAIILPFVALPIFIPLILNQRKAQKMGLVVEQESNRNFMQSIWYFIIECDAAGIILLGAGLVLFLLPFELAGSEQGQWQSAKIITMLVLGVVLLILFCFNERLWAPKPFLPYRLLLSRTVLGTCLLIATYQIAYYCWGSYFTSYLQVVHQVSIAEAGYISSSFDVTAGVFNFFVGYLISRTGRFKWLLICAVPLMILGMAVTDSSSTISTLSTSTTSVFHPIFTPSHPIVTPTHTCPRPRPVNPCVIGDGVWVQSICDWICREGPDQCPFIPDKPSTACTFDETTCSWFCPPPDIIIDTCNDHLCSESSRPTTHCPPAGRWLCDYLTCTWRCDGCVLAGCLNPGP